MFEFDLVIGLFGIFFVYRISAPAVVWPENALTEVLSELFTGSEENAFFPRKLAPVTNRAKCDYA
jgi:hypothetical protein